MEKEDIGFAGRKEKNRRCELLPKGIFRGFLGIF
jgi:hypothetical protein